MRRILLLSFLLLLVASFVPAQDGNILKFKTTTPFVVDNTTLPAGSYTIRRMSDEGELELSAAAGAPQVIVEADPMETSSGKANIQFAKYGDKLILKQIDFPDQNSFWVPMSATEKHHRKASGKPTKTSITPTK